MASSFGEQWRELAARERLVYLLLIGFIPVAGGLAFIIYRTTPYVGLAATVPILWMAGLTGAWVWFLLFRCPRCSKLFHSTWTGSTSFGTKCAHCGLARGE